MFCERQAGSVEARHDRAFGQAQAAGQLIVGEILKLAEDEDLEIPGLQRGQRLADEGHGLMIVRAVPRRGRGIDDELFRCWGVVLIRGGSDRQRLRFSSTQGQASVTQIEGDSVEPRVKMRLAVEAGDVPEGAQERFLHHLGRVFPVA